MGTAPGAVGGGAEGGCRPGSRGAGLACGAPFFWGEPIGGRRLGRPPEGVMGEGGRWAGGPGLEAGAR
jgi:hypothetical protein